MKKFQGLVFALLLFLCPTAFATSVTVSTFPIVNQQLTGATAHLRIYYNTTITDSDGHRIIVGHPGDNNNYIDVICSVANKTATCPSFTLSSTTDSSDPNTRVTAQMYDANNQFPLFFVFQGWVIPATPSTITFAQLSTYNSLQPKPYTPYYPNADQVQKMIDAVQPCPKASDVLAGCAKTSVPPSDPTNPVFVGKNDTASTSNAGVVTLASSGDTSAGKSVQGSDARLAAASTTNRGTVTTSTNNSQVASKDDYASISNAGLATLSAPPLSSSAPVALSVTDPQVTPNTSTLMGLEAYYNGQNGGNVLLGRAVSRDGQTWERGSALPIISIDYAWEGTQIHAPSVITVGQQVNLYYGGLNTKYQIGVAVSSNGGRSFSKPSSSPILTPGSSGAWDDGGVSFPTVLYDATETNPAYRWKMWFAGTRVSGQEEIGYAYSADGITWTKFGRVLPRSTGWETYSVVPGAIYKDMAGTYYLLYVGRDSLTTSGYYRAGLVTFTDPQGTYTKSPNNPLITRNASATQNLTADTLTGSKVVMVSSTTAFSVNEYVLLDDNNDIPQMNRIAAINSSTQITLRDPLLVDMTTAQVAKIRSIYYGALHPRSIWKEGSTWVASLTAFLHYQEAGYITESTVFATAPALSGPWTLDIKRGVGIERKAGMWDSISAENFSVQPLHFFVDAAENQTRALRTTNQSIPNSTATAISFDTASYGSGWSAASPTRLVSNRAGVRTISARVQFDLNAVGARSMQFKITLASNGATVTLTVDLKDASATIAPILQGSVDYFFNQGDSVEVVVFQNSGAPLNILADTSGQTPVASIR
jgi:hypothetical protein